MKIQIGRIYVNKDGQEAYVWHEDDSERSVVYSVSPRKFTEFMPLESFLEEYTLKPDHICEASATPPKKENK